MKEAMTLYILAWSKMERIPQKMLLMEITKVVKGWKKTETSAQPFAVPFIVDSGTRGNNIRTFKLLTTQRICQHALGTIHIYWEKVTRTLLRHVDNNTLPVHMNTRGNFSNFNFEKRMLPCLRDFFKNETLPLSGPRSSWYTCNNVTESINEIANIIKLDPGIFKRGLYMLWLWLCKWTEDFTLCKWIYY